MTNNIIKSMVVLSLTTSSLLATNGTILVGYGAKSRAMGGTGVANYKGAESAFNNPALIVNSESETELTVVGTYLSKDISYSKNAIDTNVLEAAPGKDGGDYTYNSEAGAKFIPSIAAIHKISDKYSIAFAIYGAGESSVDYSGEADITAISRVSLSNTKTSFSLAYKGGAYAFAVSPVFEIAKFSVDSANKTDLGLGYELSMAYNKAGFTAGLDYKSSVSHNFKNSFNSNIDRDTYETVTPAHSNLNTPAVINLGFAYNAGASTIELDYKNIAYSATAGYDELGWGDQNIYALGYEYATKKWAGRFGYNYGSSPLPTVARKLDSSYGQVIKSIYELPSVSDTHYSFGGTYSPNETVSIDFAYVMAYGDTSSDFTAHGVSSQTTVRATNNQKSLSLAVNYIF